jgi:phospholipase/carboxylesterase
VTAAPEAAARPAPVPEPLRAGELVYVERILGGADASDPLPMIVAIHGLGDTPDNFAHVLDTFPGKARLILPQGVDPLDPLDGGGFSWFPIRARDPDVEALSAGIRASADKIAAAIEVLAKRRPTQGRPIVTGFSQGGMLTFALAITHPEVVGLALPIGGWLPPPLAPTAGPGGDQPAIVAFHGTDDRAVAFEPTAASIEQLRGLGYDVTLRVYEGVGHAITPEIRRDWSDLLVDGVAGARKEK